MKSKLLVGLGLVGLLATNQINSQNTETHLINKSKPFYHPMVDFDGTEEYTGGKDTDFLRVKRNKKGNFDLYLTEVSCDKRLPEKHLATLEKNYRHELVDFDNDNDLDLTEKIFIQNPDKNMPNKHKLYVYENINNELQSKKFVREISCDEYYIPIGNKLK